MPHPRVLTDELANGSDCRRIRKDTDNPVLMRAGKKREKPQRIAQILTHTAAGAHLQLQFGKSGVVLALQHLGDKRLLVRKQMMKHPRTQTRLGGKQPHRQALITEFRIKPHPGGEKSLARRVGQRFRKCRNRHRKTVGVIGQVSRV